MDESTLTDEELAVRTRRLYIQSLAIWLATAVLGLGTLLLTSASPVLPAACFAAGLIGVTFTSWRLLKFTRLLREGEDDVQASGAGRA